jgi:D-tagatose-1,6-bisphosphate aldolase subunit GatZ/KbaZ
LTFRFREAVWALAEIEAHMDIDNPSNVREVMTQRMTDAPNNWQYYYSGSDADVARLRIYSYSDRIRYYWADADVTAALSKLFSNLSAQTLPETLVSQSFLGLEFGEIPTNAGTLLEDHINRCVNRYFEAAGYS